MFTVGVLSQEEAVLYEYEDYDFECPDEYLGYFPHLFRYTDTRKWRGNLYSPLVPQIDPSVPQPVFTITEKAPTRAFSWLKAPTSAFTFKTLC